MSVVYHLEKTKEVASRTKCRNGSRSAGQRPCWLQSACPPAESRPRDPPTRSQRDVEGGIIALLSVPGVLPNSESPRGHCRLSLEPRYARGVPHSPLSPEEHPFSPEYFPVLIDSPHPPPPLTLSQSMATERQIQANRANAAKSTGPVTPESKRISSQNASTHRLLSGVVILKGESLRRYNDLTAALVLQFHPRNSAETALIQTMAVAKLLKLCETPPTQLTTESKDHDFRTEANSEASRPRNLI